METPQISRSGRVLKKSAKVKEMEDFDINELDMQGKPRKKGRTSDEYDEFEDKRVAPIKIPKMSLSLPSGAKRPQIMPKTGASNAMKAKSEAKRYMLQDSDGSKESDSSSVSSETSSSSPSSSDDSDGEMPDMRQRYSNVDVKSSSLIQNVQHSPQQEKVIVEPYRQFESPVTFGEQSSEMPMDASDDDESDSGLVIAEESNDSFMSRGAKAGGKKKPVKKDPSYPARKGGSAKKRPPVNRNPAATVTAKKEKPRWKIITVGMTECKPQAVAVKPKPLTAYMLWCSENRKKIAAGHIGFGNIGKKLGEAWQALPDKEKMAWRRKAKKLALKNSGGLISTGPTNESPTKVVSRSTMSISNEGALQNSAEATRALGTSAIDSAAYLKLLGDSLSVIGQRLTEHEGQLAVSGIFSVLLDTILCVVGPLLCLTSESPVLNSLPQDVSRRTLDSIAYFMPGL